VLITSWPIWPCRRHSKCIPPPFTTDHPLLSINFQIFGNTSEHQLLSTSSDIERYRLAALDRPIIANLLRETFETQASLLPAALDSFHRDLPITSLEDRKIIIDELDKLLIAALDNAANEVLGKYKPYTERSRPDFTSEHLANSNKQDDIMRLRFEP
jgi:hypothetical protein